MEDYGIQIKGNQRTGGSKAASWRSETKGSIPPRGRPTNRLLEPAKKEASGGTSSLQIVKPLHN
jgi:hypothetical protein